MSGRTGLLLSVVALLGAAGCGRSATASPVEGRTGAYEIECVQAPNCVAKAHEVCGERFDIVREWEHPLAMPDAEPPARDYPRHSAQQVADWEGYSTITGPNDAATAPPLRRLDVVCVN